MSAARPLPTRTQRLSRRSAIAAGSLDLAAAVGLSAPPIAAREAGLPQAVAACIAGWKTRDANQIADTCAENGISESAASGLVLEGREAIRQYLTAYLGAYSDLTVDISTAFAGSDQAAMAWVSTGSYTGEVPGSPREPARSSRSGPSRCWSSRRTRCSGRWTISISTGSSRTWASCRRSDHQPPTRRHPPDSPSERA